MKSFQYRFLDRSGRPEVITIQADSLPSAQAHLAREGIAYLSIAEAGSPLPEPDPPPTAPARPEPPPPEPRQPGDRQAARPALAAGSMFGAVLMALASPILIMILGPLIYEPRPGWSAQGPGFGFFLFGIFSLPIFLIRGITVGSCWTATAMRPDHARAAAFARIGVALYPALLLGIVVAVAATFGLFSLPATLAFLIACAWPVPEVAEAVHRSRRPRARRAPGRFREKAG